MALIAFPHGQAARLDRTNLRPPHLGRLILSNRACPHLRHLPLPTPKQVNTLEILAREANKSDGAIKSLIPNGTWLIHFLKGDATAAQEQPALV